MNDLTEIMKKVVLTGIGAAAMSAEKVQEIVDELVKKGECTIEQGKVLNEELKHKVAEKKDDLLKPDVEHMSKEARSELLEKLRKMEDEENENVQDKKEE